MKLDDISIITGCLYQCDILYQALYTVFTSFLCMYAMLHSRLAFVMGQIKLEIADNGKIAKQYPLLQRRVHI
jgi:hypothetical protein